MELALFSVNVSMKIVNCREKALMTHLVHRRDNFNVGKEFLKFLVRHVGNTDSFDFAYSRDKVIDMSNHIAAYPEERPYPS